MSDIIREIRPDDRGEIDDIAITSDGHGREIEMFRLERMTSGGWWTCVYYKGGGRDFFTLHSKRKIACWHSDERAE